MSNHCIILWNIPPLPHDLFEIVTNGKYCKKTKILKTLAISKFMEFFKNEKLGLGMYRLAF